MNNTNKGTTSNNLINYYASVYEAICHYTACSNEIIGLRQKYNAEKTSKSPLFISIGAAVAGYLPLVYAMCLPYAVFFYFYDPNVKFGGKLTGSIFVVSIFVDIALAVILYRFLNKKRNKKADDLKNSIESKTDGLRKYANENANLLNALPADYRYPLAAETIYKFIRDRRVNTLNDALGMYDEQLHRWKVERINQEMLVEQQKQTQTLRNIEIDTSLLLWTSK